MKVAKVAVPALSGLAICFEAKNLYDQVNTTKEMVEKKIDDKFRAMKELVNQINLLNEALNSDE